MRLIIIVATVISCSVLISLVFFQATRKTYPGVDRWTAGVGLLTVGYLALALRGLIPDSLSILIGNVAFPLGLVLQLDGLHRFLGATSMSRLWYALPALDLVATVGLYYVHDSAFWRNVTITIAISAPHWPMAALIFRHPVKDKSIFYPVIGLLLCLAGLVVLARPISAFFLPQWHLLMDSPFQLAAFIALIVFQLGESLSLMMLNSEHVERELLETEADLKQTLDQLQRALAEQKKGEDALRGSEERFKQVAENAGEWIWEVDANGVYQYCSSAVEKILGYSPDELVGHKHFFDLFAPEVQEELKEVALGGVESRESFRGFVNPNVHKNGRIIILETSGSPLLDDQGALFGYRGTHTDITERKQAEEALQESEEKYRSVVENMQDVFYRTDMQGTIVMASPSGPELMGYESINQMIGLNVARDFYKNPDERDRLLATLREKGEVRNYEVELVRKDGNSITVSSNSHIYHDKSGKPLGVEGVLTDITARKQSEQALRESEEKYRILAEKANEGVFVAQDAVIRFVNPRGAEIVGHREHELISKAFTEFIHPDDREMALRYHFRRLRGEDFTSRYPLRIFTKDGNLRWVEIDAASIQWEGRPAVLVLMTDVTERKQMEEALKESEEWYRSLLEESFDGMFVQKDRNIIFANSRLHEMLGYASGELHGMDHRLTCHPDYREITGQRALARMNGEDVISQYEVNMQRKDGSCFAGEISAKALKVKGEPGTQVWVRDISKRKRMEGTQKRLATAVEQAAEGIVITDTKGNIEYVNPAYERITGFSLAEVVGTKASVLKVHEQDTEFTRKIFDSLAEEELWCGRTVGLRKDGTQYDTDVTISPVRDPDGNVINFVGVERDITRELQLQRQLLQAQKMEAIGTLAGGVAHDFNNLLTVVQGFSELLLAEKDQKHPEYADLQKIFHAARNGADLVQRLLMFSRKSEPKPVPMNLNKQIVQVKKLLRRTIPKMIDIRLDLYSDLPDINADPSQIEQVLMNLAINARDAMSENGKLTLKTEVVTLDEEYCMLHIDANPGEYVLLEISDTGHGMDEETTQHIFEPFFTTKEIGRGTGLGLAMAYGIVIQHNGHITVHSEVGKGTTFRVYLPAIQGEAETDVETDGIMPAFGTETVLLVDDEDFVRELGARILTKHGYTVLQATNGREALDLFKKESSQISLVILDLIMPEMGGTECLKDLLKIDPQTKILAASGYSADASVKETIHMGAKGFVTKPFRVKELLRDVRRVLDES